MTMTMGLVRALAEDVGAGLPLVHLLGQPRVSQDDRDARVAEGVTRLLAFLSLNDGENDRRIIAAALWPDVDEVRAAGNLRTALWRVNRTGMPLVEACKSSLRLGERVQVDVRLLGEWAARVISGAARHDDLAHASWDVERLEILPGWYDDWIILERERLRQRLLHALEVLARFLIAAARCAEAVDVALVATTADPLRESAQKVLIEAHLAEGNRGHAWSTFERHRALLREELGVEPAPQLAALVQRAGLPWRLPTGAPRG
jgi:DNA-binding SARP family transcriptional activator